MIVLPGFEGLNIYLVFLGFLFLGSLIFVSLLLSKTKYFQNQKLTVFYAAFCGLAVTASSAALAFAIPLVPGATALYFFLFLNYLFGFICIFFLFRNGLIPLYRFNRNLLYSFALSFIIFALMSLNYIILYADNLDLKPIDLIISFLLTQITIFSLIRFLHLYANDNRRNSIWALLAACLAALSLSGIGYCILMGIIDMSAFPTFPFSPSALLLLVLIANTLLMVISHYYGNRVIVESHELYKSLFNNNPTSVLAIDESRKISTVNQEGLAFSGYRMEALLGKSPSLIIQDEQLDACIDRVFKGRSTRLETVLHHKDGNTSNVILTLIPTILKKRVVGAFIIIIDVTANRVSEQKIEFLAYHDELTSLPNRRYMRQVLEGYKALNTPFTIMLIDFDRLKRINDTFGHSFGDKVLVKAASRLKQAVDSDVTVTRLGGDEFLLIFPQVDHQTIAHEIVELFQSPITVDGYELILKASIGLAAFPEHGEEIDSLYKYADIAMYHSKENGGNTYTVYRPEMSEKQVSRFEIETDLQQALNDKAFLLYFQPKFNSTTRELEGAEVLLRWKHPERGFIPPNVFIPIAEETGLIVAIERNVMESVMCRISDWKKQGKNLPTISINVSMITFLEDDFTDYFNNLLKKYQLSGDMLELEITERVVMQNETEVNETLQQLRQTGVSISIDDFGTGYSSLNYLDKLQVDILKIDQSFIQNIEHNQAIVAAIISLAHNLQLCVIAEGVETENQLQVLQQLGCHHVQGYLFSKPLEASLFEQTYIWL